MKKQIDQFNQMIVMGEEMKKKKGDGINAVLVLMKELRDFQEQIDDCMEAQALAENKAKIEEFYKFTEKMYKELLVIAEGGIRAGPRKEEPKEEIKPEQKQPIMVNAPVIPKM